MPALTAFFNNAQFSFLLPRAVLKLPRKMFNCEIRVTCAQLGLTATALHKMMIDKNQSKALFEIQRGMKINLKEGNTSPSFKQTFVSSMLEENVDNGMFLPRALDQYVGHF